MKIREILNEAFDWDDVKHRYTRDDAHNEHRISLWNSSGTVGYIEWDIDDGEINKVYVGDSYRRLGIATKMWEMATEWAEENDEVVPEHSSSRTKAGDEWAKSIGGKIPDLTDDIDGWTRNK